MSDIPEEVHKEHMAVCEKCPTHRYYAAAFNVHLSWLDCPYVCKERLRNVKETKL